MTKKKMNVKLSDLINDVHKQETISYPNPNFEGFKVKLENQKQLSKKKRMQFSFFLPTVYSLLILIVVGSILFLPSEIKEINSEILLMGACLLEI